MITISVYLSLFEEVEVCDSVDATPRVELHGQLTTGACPGLISLPNIDVLVSSGIILKTTSASGNSLCDIVKRYIVVAINLLRQRVDCPPAGRSL
jgi:hypothetical protein